MMRNWEIHYVIDEKAGRGSAHTHGLDKYGSLEIEINLNLRPTILGQYLNFIGARIANGLKIIDDERTTGLFECPVYFIKTKSIQSEDLVLRTILPDENLWFPWDEYNGKHCKPGYREQITFDTFKVWYVVVDFESEKEMKDKISAKKDMLAVGFWIDKIDGLQLTTKPYRFITSKGQLFNGPSINSRNEHNRLLHLADILEPNKVSVFCKDATPEQIADYQKLLYLRDDEL